jgi:uncharacterized LabA/DUF88 family protein
LAHQERVNLAVFIDFDNIEIGVKTTLGEHFDIGTILEALKERGEVVTKIAYADWTRAGEYSRALTQHAIRLVQRNLTPGGDKNGADINLALDALEMAFTHPHINAYVIVGGDSDFLSLVEKLKQYDKKVFVVGGRAFTSVILQRNCHEFIAYENLVRRPSSKGGRPAVAQAAAPVTSAFALVRRALKILADREVTPQTGLLKSTLLQLDSTFSERNYGASSFLDFAEKLAQAGLVQLKHSGRSVTVELNPGFSDDGAASVAGAGDAERAARPVEESTAAAGPRPVEHGRPDEHAPGPPPAQLGDQADGVRSVATILGRAGRWPMYVRNVKQLLRAGGFDERAYGFGGLMDLLRACQRESLVRLERDRRGGLRVFQGPSLARGAMIPTTPAVPIFDIANELEETLESPIVVAEPVITVPADVDGDLIEAVPLTVVDTTAEMLGRAKARRPRARALAAIEDQPAAAASRARGSRKGVAKKTTGAGARRGPRKKEKVPES